MYRGYFQGTFSGSTAYVSYYEMTPFDSNDGYYPTTGSGTLEYSWDGTSASFDWGNYWTAGQTDFPDGYLYSWGNLVPCNSCTPSDSESWSTAQWIKYAKQTCLWSPHDQYNEHVQVNLNNQIYGPKGFENAWFSDGVGPLDTRGSTLGGYLYTYSKKECSGFEPEFSCDDGNVELGHYNLNAISANVGQNRVFVSLWNATTGPLTGQVGTIIGLIQSNSMQGTGATDMDNSAFNGVFCYYDVDSTTGYTILDQCTVQVSKRTKKDQVMGQYLASAYEGYLETKRSAIYKLKWLVNKLWGN
jgi:hypothetical protein